MAPSLIAPIDDLAPEPRRESMSDGGRTLSLVEQAVERLRSESLRDDYPTLDVIDDSPIEPQNLVRRDFTNEGDPAHDVDKRTSEEIGPFIDPQISAPPSAKPRGSPRPGRSRQRSPWPGTGTWSTRVSPVLGRIHSGPDKTTHVAWALRLQSLIIRRVRCPD